MMFISLIQIMMQIEVNWSQITDKIGRMFLGGEEYIGLDGLPHLTPGIVGDPMLLGAVVFVILFVMTLMFGLGMLVGSTVIIPSAFLVFQWVPDLRIVVAIVCGLVFGMGLHQIVKR